VRGPVQLAFGRSVERIFTGEHSITRMAVTNERDLEKERTMGRKFTVPYGLYRTHGFISAPLAKQTGFSEKDLQLLWDALMSMFDHDRSAARGEMATQRLIVFKHDSDLGNAPAHKLFSLVSVINKNHDRPARTFSDYDVIVNKDAVPSGIALIELL
jgi:CRISPR-associated protein Csd2